MSSASSPSQSIPTSGLLDLSLLTVAGAVPDSHWFPVSTEQVYHRTKKSTIVIVGRFFFFENDKDGGQVLPWIEPRETQYEL